MHRLDDIDEVTFRLATREDLKEMRQGSLSMYSYSAINDTAVCPTYGAVTYGRRLVPKISVSSQAMLMGGAAHECFAALRLWQLAHQQGLPDHAEFHGKRLFGDVWWSKIRSAGKSPDPYTSAANMLVATLEGTGFVNDPGDRRRTVENLEEGLLKYLAEYDAERFPVWVMDESEPSTLIGVEMPCILYAEFCPHFDKPIKFLLVGAVDGIHTDLENNEIVVNENKTTSRLTESWATAFITSHQIQIYTLMASMLTKQNITSADVYGLTVPLPKTGGMGGFHREPIRDMQDMFPDLTEWMLYGVQMLQTHTDDPVKAPQFSHSCNRYFQSCSLLGWCGMPRDARPDALEQFEERDETHSLDLLDAYSAGLQL